MSEVVIFPIEHARYIKNNMSCSRADLFDRIRFVAVVAAFWLAFPTPLAAGQDPVQAEIKRTRKDYQKITSELKNYKKIEVRWESGTASPGVGTTYTGYFDPANKLVLLKYARGEEGYWSEHEYYFRDEEIFFIFIHSGTPDGAEKEERIYITSKLILHALLKTKAAGDSRKIGDLENKRYDAVMDNIDASSRTYYLGVEAELSHFNEALKKR